MAKSAPFLRAVVLLGAAGLLFGLGCVLDWDVPQGACDICVSTDTPAETGSCYANLLGFYWNEGQCVALYACADLCNATCRQVLWTTEADCTEAHVICSGGKCDE